MTKHVTWLLVVGLMLPVAVHAEQKVKGYEYPDTLTIEGQPMQLVGAGVRNKWFFDVYVLSAYAAKKQCDAVALVRADMPKYLRIDMLRDVSADRMASTIGESFSAHMPKDADPGLEQQRQTFEGYFKDELTKGTTLEFLYVPGQGTTIKQGGKALGPALKGAEFSRVLWDIYFGAESCCGSTKKDILGYCGK